MFCLRLLVLPSHRHPRHSEKIQFRADAKGELVQPLCQRRTLAGAVAALQIVADFVAMGTAVPRGQILILVMINIAFIASAIGGLLGAARLNHNLQFFHWMLSGVLVLVLVGIGIADYVKESSWLRLALYAPALVDIAATVTSLMLWIEFGAELEREEEIEAERARVRDEREQAAQAERHRQFEEEKKRRDEEKKQREREAADADEKTSVDSSAADDPDEGCAAVLHAARLRVNSPPMCACADKKTRRRSVEKRKRPR